MKEQLAVESAGAQATTNATPATLTEAMAPLTDVDPWMQRKMEEAAAKQAGSN
jgi:hypothetical protein